uniref:Proteasome 20S subunit beta 1 n=1 Tax=Accipiter nisus TaxID=211598 RepID=A0A8B9NCE7_9AVES
MYEYSSLSTVLAIAGEDFSIVASDTRLSEGYAIHCRDSPKCYKLTEQTVIGCSGFHGDCLTLTKIIEARLKMYKHSNNKTMTTGAIAAMLSTILYSRRFFPYYVYNIIGGLDEEGKTSKKRIKREAKFLWMNSYPFTSQVY